MLQNALHQFLTAELGDSYLAGFGWHGHPEIPNGAKSGDLNSVIVICDDVPLETIRRPIVDFCAQQTCEMGLTVIHKRNFDTFLRLNRPFAHRLKDRVFHSGIRLSPGESSSNDGGWLAWHLLAASGECFASDAQNGRLHAICPEADGSNLERFSQLQRRLTLADVPIEMGKLTSPPIIFPEPVSVYLKLDQLILISDDPVKTLRTVKPADLQVWMDSQAATTVQTCTPAQFVASIQSEDLVTARLLSYRHIWGADLLGSLDLRPDGIARSAAKIAAYWQFFGMSKLLFTRPLSAENDHKTIHDLQNRLLNLRLQNELLHRLEIFPNGMPPIEIPDRSAPIPVRLKAIEGLFAWWADFYLEQANRAF